ncbi:MAG TPA: DUF4846 domain-containing protein [Clostridiaceae bacterium]|nr:DUF4846 domain-containing protein [Clostridiaceae bacterium]
MKKKKIILCLVLAAIVFLTACSGRDATGGKQDTVLPKEKDLTESSLSSSKPDLNITAEAATDLINEKGNTVEERIEVPKGFKRVNVIAGSFAEYLRTLPLKPHGSKVKYYDGNEKPSEVYEAVIDIDVGDRDLQQCADAVMRLWAEYLYSRGFFDKIHFNFTNGFNAEYTKWRQGHRIKVEGNKVYWVKEAEASNDYDSFRKYLNMVFAYAGTLSLSKEMKKVPLENMAIGDVFIEGGSPGHCVIVIDMAENVETGEKLFILAQSYMPAQDIHILKNPANGDGNPWYTVNFGEVLKTPEWEFTRDQLMRFNS